MRIDQFLLHLQPKQILRPTDRQILNSRMSIKLAMKPKCKADIYNKEKTMKHGASFPKLS